MRRILTPLLAAVLLTSSCEEPVTTESLARLQAPTAAELEAFGPSTSHDLAVLRQVTAAFHDFDAARAAGWSAPITDCMTSDQGGMGFHYGNTHLINGSVHVDEPELLLYEPERNGRMRLVAVEYIIPVDMWSSSQPPRLFGRDFKVSEEFQVWALHAWVWKENPNGMFADWNPRVNCDHASATSTMAH